MPFKSEEQRRYLWANEPEIARDWTETYGSKIKKADGGITRLGFQRGGPGGHEDSYEAGKAYEAANQQRSQTFDAGRDKTGGWNARENQMQRNAAQATHTTAPFTLSDPEEKKDYFTQSYVGPSIFGGTGYRDTVVPNTTQYGNRSRLGSAVLSGIGLLGGIPGLGFLPSALQSLGPFNNKAFYDQKVVPAGKTNLSYEDYMAARMAGKIDAYGNPINNTGNENRSGIATIYDYNMFDDVDQNLYDDEETVNELQDFLQRFRLADEYRQNPYTVDTPIKYT
jgi:hypothetical protein